MIPSSSAGPSSALNSASQDAVISGPDNLKNKRRNRASHHYQPSSMDLIFNPTHNFTRFFVISSSLENKTNLTEIDSITGNDDLERHLQGKPKEVTELRGGQLLVEVTDARQSQKIVSLSILANIPVKAVPHDKLNQVKGTIRYPNRPNFTDEQLLSTLKKYDVIDIYRLMKKVKEALIPLPVYILTFGKTHLPEKIAIGWTKCNVRQYIPRPRRCFKCQKFGHGAKTCRAEFSSCTTCGQMVTEDHIHPCTRPAMCTICGGNHAASSSSCPLYKQESEILTLQTKERIRYTEARRIVMARNIRSNETFASVTAKTSRNTGASTSKGVSQHPLPSDGQAPSQREILISPTQTREESPKTNRISRVASDALASLAQMDDPNLVLTPPLPQSNLFLTPPLPPPYSPPPPPSPQPKENEVGPHQRKRALSASGSSPVVSGKRYQPQQQHGRSLINRYPMPPGIPTYLPNILSDKKKNEVQKEKGQNRQKDRL